MAEITVLCDMRESRSGIIDRLRDMGAGVQVGELDCGDFVLSGSVVVERKTAVDFVSSIVDGRLFNQSAKLRLNFQRPVFLILGDLYATRSAITREAIDGAVSFLVAIEGVSVLYVRDETAAAGLIYRMASHCQKGLGYDVAFRRGKVPAGSGEALFVIEGLPGVGPSTAIKLLNHFRSVEAVMQASMDDLKAIPGLGPKKAERIFTGIRWVMPEGQQVDSSQSLFTVAIK